MSAVLQKLFDSGALWVADGMQYHSDCFAIPPSLDTTSLPSGNIHEFFYGGDLPLCPSNCSMFSSDCSAIPIPRIIPTLIALKTAQHSKYIVWIGRRCWPTPFLLEDQHAHCVFLDPPNYKLTLWALELVLRTHGVGAVIAPCDRLTFALSRRLSLAAAKGNTLGIILRQPRDLHIPSAALTRWVIKNGKNGDSYLGPHYTKEMGTEVTVPIFFPIFSQWHIELKRWKGYETTIPVSLPSRMVNQ